MHYMVQHLITMIVARFVGTGGFLIKYPKKGKGHPCTGTVALYRPYGP